MYTFLTDVAIAIGFYFLGAHRDAAWAWLKRTFTRNKPAVVAAADKVSQEVQNSIQK